MATRRLLLYQTTRKILDGLKTNNGDLSELSEELHNCIGTDPELVTYFAKLLLGLLEGEEDHRSKAIALHMINHYAKDHEALESLIQSNTHFFVNFIRILQSDDTCSEELKNYTGDVMADWCSRFVSFRQNEEINNFVVNHIRKKLDTAITWNWSEISEQMTSELKKFTKWLIAVSFRLEAANYFCETLKSTKQEELSRKIYAFCLVLMEKSQDFKNVIECRTEFSIAKRRFEAKLKAQVEKAKSPPPPPPPPPPPVQAKRNNANNRLSNAANHILEESRMERYCIRTDMVEKGKLGRGALGTAVLVQLHDNPTLMVVKKFNVQQSLYVDEMHKEFSKLVECGNHTHIVQLYGLVCEDEQKTRPIGILMEHMDCGSLHDFLHKTNEPYGEKEVLDWGRQAASALNHLHKQRLIHRDIKSDNILLTRVDGKKQLKIADFGMVSRDKTELKGSPKSLCGTQYYLAPEGYPWHPGDCTSAMDIYSLGITLWEMAQRMRPYNEDNLVFEDEKRTIRRPSLENPAYCWLPGLVKRMWAEDASARPTASEVYAKLNELYCRFK